MPIINAYTPGFAPMLGTATGVIAQQSNVTTATIYAAVDNVSEFNLHPYLEYEEDLFWSMWSTGVGPDEDDDGQRVRYATSADGLTGWGASVGYITPAPPSGFRYIARGFWKRNDEFLALVSLDEYDEGYFGASLELHAYIWNGSSWGFDQVVAVGYINNFPPVLLPGGDWIMAVRDVDGDIFYARGDIGSWAYESADEGSANLNEPNVNIHSNGVVSATFRTQDGPTIWRAISTDGGESFPPPKATNFIDARSKHFILELEDGRSVMASNISAPLDRTDLHLSVSEDGLTFDRVRILINTATSIQFPSSAKVPGYMYPHKKERGGYLYVAYSRNKEDIMISRVAVSDLPASP